MKIEKETTRRILEFYSDLYHFHLEKNSILMRVRDFLGEPGEYSSELSRFELPFHFKTRVLDSYQFGSLGKNDWIFRKGKFIRILFRLPFYLFTEDLFGKKKWIKESFFFEEEPVYFLSADPVRPFSLGETSVSPEKRILSLIRMESSDISILTVFSIFAALLSLVIPVGTQSFVNILAFGTQMQPVIVLTFLITGALTFAGVLKILQMSAAEILQQRLFARVFTEIISFFPVSHSDSFLETENRRKLNYLLDISTAQKSATVLLTDGLAILLQMFVGTVVLVLYHPIFVLYDIFVIILCYYVIIKLGKDGISTSILESKYKHKTVFWLEEAFEKYSAIQGKKGLSAFQRKAEGLAGDYLHCRRNHFQIVKKQASVFIFFQAFGTAVLLGLGGFLVIKGEISLGQFVAAEIIAAKIMESFSKSPKYLESYYDLCASLDKISHVMEASDFSSKSKKVKTEGQNILEFKKAHFSSFGKTYQIQNSSFHIGDSVKFEGEKATFGNFSRLLHPSDGHTIKTDSDISFFGENSVLISSPVFFSGSLDDNLDLFTEKADFVNLLKFFGFYSQLQTQLGEDFFSLKLSDIAERLDQDQLFLFYISLVLRKNAALVILDPPPNLSEKSYTALNELIQEKLKGCVVIHCNDRIIFNRSLSVLEEKKDV